MARGSEPSLTGSTVTGDVPLSCCNCLEIKLRTLLTLDPSGVRCISTAWISPRCACKSTITGDSFGSDRAKPLAVTRKPATNATPCPFIVLNLVEKCRPAILRRLKLPISACRAVVSESGTSLSSVLRLLSSDFFDFRYLNLQVESRFYLGSMNEEKGQESSALDEIMVSRIEIEGLGVAANEKEMTDSVRALPGVREVKIENGAMFVTYDPLDTTEKKIEEAVRASGNTVKAATTDTETPHP